MKAEIYTKDNCGFCTRAKMFFKNNGIEYDEYIISPGFNEDSIAENQRYVTKEQLLEKAPHAKTVPQIWIDGKYIGGWTELEEHFKNK